MNIVDIIILILLGFGALLGFKRGFTRQLVSLVGIFAALIIAFLFKNPLSVFFYKNLPFINFGGLFKDMTVINILFYESLAFFIIFIILMIILKILSKLTKIFEKILTLTIILGIPSKILGAILGIVQNIIYIFVILYLIKFTSINFEELDNSKVANIILDKTPIISNVCESSIGIYNEILNYKSEYENTNDLDTYNQKILLEMIDKKIITKENAQVLIEQGKLKNVNVN